MALTRRIRTPFAGNIVPRTASIRNTAQTCYGLSAMPRVRRQVPDRITSGDPEAAAEDKLRYPRFRVLDPRDQ